MSKVLIIGAGGVSGVVVKKCAALPGVFSEIMLASRTKAKCDAIAAQLSRPIQTAQVDADNVPELVGLIRSFDPDLVLNVALPYQDLHIMDACLETGVAYLDTANYEPEDTAKFEYKWQWDYHDRFKEAGITALLGSGFDPGVTSVFCTYIQKHHLDEIHTIDIIDVNAGDHGYPFATNFNPEINIREVTAKGRYWENGEWIETAPLSVKRIFEVPENIGTPNKFYDTSGSRDGSGYMDVTDSSDPEVLEAKARFRQILEDLPAPRPDDPAYPQWHDYVRTLNTYQRLVNFLNTDPLGTPTSENTSIRIDDWNNVLIELPQIPDQSELLLEFTENLTSPGQWITVDRYTPAADEVGQPFRFDQYQSLDSAFYRIRPNP